MGVWGWVVFAAPNVIGAAAMGFVLSSRTQSLRLVKDHAWMMRVFSWVTIAFHVYFVKWFVDGRLGIHGALFYLAGLTMVFGYGVYRWKGGANGLAGLGWIFSMGVMGFCVWYGMGHEIPTIATTPRALDAAWMAPVCLMGFLLCPYLDLTFHQGRLALGKGSGRWGFALGFGVVFFAMILFSLKYAPWLAGSVAVEGGNRPPDAIRFAIGAHLLVQAALTVVFHMNALAKAKFSELKGKTVGWILGAIMLPIALADLLGNGSWFGMLRGEVGYRGFLGFYGLMFPVYGLMCLWRGRPSFGEILRVFLVVLGALPFYTMGFLVGKMIWLVPGVIVVLLGWQQEGFIRRRGAAARG